MRSEIILFYYVNKDKTYIALQNHTFQLNKDKTNSA